MENIINSLQTVSKIYKNNFYQTFMLPKKRFWYLIKIKNNDKNKFLDYSNLKFFVSLLFLSNYMKVKIIHKLYYELPLFKKMFSFEIHKRNMEYLIVNRSYMVSTHFCVRSNLLNMFMFILLKKNLIFLFMFITWGKTSRSASV